VRFQAIFVMMIRMLFKGANGNIGTNDFMAHAVYFFIMLFHRFKFAYLYQRLNKMPAFSLKGMRKDNVKAASTLRIFTHI
jgi:hypothetical protein